MGVSLMWLPTSNDWKHVEANYVSDDVAKIRKSFGDELTEEDLPKLRAFYEATEKDFWKELADLVESHGTISLKEEY